MSRPSCCASAGRTAMPPSSTARARATPRCCTASVSPSASSTSSAAAPICGRTCRPRPRSSRVRMTYGTKADYKSAGREPTDYVNSKLILMWGWSPADGTFGTGTQQYLKDAKKKGVRIVCVDPRRTRTSVGARRRAYLHQALDRCRGADRHGLCHRERGPARPGLLRPPCAGLRRGASAGRRARRRVLQVVPAGRERRRAQDAGMGGGASPACRPRRSGGSPSNSPPPSPPPCSAATRPAARRSASSSIAPPTRWPRSPAMSASSAAIRASATARRAAAGIKSLPPGTNPIKSHASRRRCSPIFWRAASRGGYPADIKVIYSAGGDLFNQCPNANKMAASLDGVEFIVVQDHFLTPTARHADIVLPATTFWERNDVHTPWAGAGHYAIFMKQAIQPMYECRNDIDIFADLAARVGINDYSRRPRWNGCASSHPSRSTISTRSPKRAWRASRRRRMRWPSRRRSAIPRPTSSRRRRARSRSIRWRWRPIPTRMAWATSRPFRPGSSR